VLKVTANLLGPPVRPESKSLLLYSETQVKPLTAHYASCDEDNEVKMMTQRVVHFLNSAKRQRPRQM